MYNGPLLERRWRCNYCEAEFSEPFFIEDDVDRFDPTYRMIVPACPYCGTTNITEMEPCSECDTGYKMPGKKVCHKCHLRLKGELGRFARLFSTVECEELDDMMEGNSLADFR